MLVAAAICPHPPLLVPTLASGAAGELDDVRVQCGDAVAALRDSDIVYVVGVDGGVCATRLAPWGADVALDVPEPMPLPLLVGAWLTTGTLRSFVIVDADLDGDECAALGAELAASATGVALLVMGDGSARHHEKAPGYLDPRAAAYDEHVATALGNGDIDALRALDPQLSTELLVAGRAPWQVLAGAAAGHRPQVRASAFTAPYGVGYHVASWVFPS